MSSCCEHGNERHLGCAQCMTSIKIDKALKTGNIAFAADDEIEALRPEVDRVLDALGARGWFSNDSRVSDLAEGRLPRARFILGLDINVGDRLVDIAQQLKDRRR